jgi:hypothetical protein
VSRCPLITIPVQTHNLKYNKGFIIIVVSMMNASHKSWSPINRVSSRFQVHRANDYTTEVSWHLLNFGRTLHHIFLTPHELT